MRLLTFLLMLCAAVIQGGCVQSAPDSKAGVSTSDQSVYNHLNPEVILTGKPLPVPGVNQRPVVGTKKVLLVVGQWTGTPALNKDVLWSQSLSPEEKTSLRSYIADVSGGKLTLEGKMISADFGAKPAKCDARDAVRGPAEAAARAQGLNPDDYDYLFIAASCNGTGSADAPGRVLAIYSQPASSHLWIRLFGNNLGFLPGPTYSGCRLNGTVITAPDQCKTIFYPDYGDPVSGGLEVLYPTHYRWYAGWLDESHATHIKSSGLYRLIIRRSYLIDRPTTSPNQPRQIALEVRQPALAPFDSLFPEKFALGVWARYTKMDTYVQDIQLDGTPETLSTQDATLPPGRTLKDEAAGITMNVCALSPSLIWTAAVSIGVNGEAPPACSLQKPDLASPKNGESIKSDTVFSGTMDPRGVVYLVLRGTTPPSYGSYYVIPDKKGGWSLRVSGMQPGTYLASVWNDFGGLPGNSTPITVYVTPGAQASNE